MLEIASNKKAYHNFEILETIEAGLVLTGPEIKAVRAHKLNLAGSYAKLLTGRESGKPELFWVGGSIMAVDGDPTRSRKLLVHNHEINRLIGKIQEKKLTLVPLRIYLNHGLAKLELGIARGKQLYDKRETIKRKNVDRELQRSNKNK